MKDLQLSNLKVLQKAVPFDYSFPNLLLQVPARNSMDSRYPAHHYKYSNFLDFS
jgi:hypothetical protein